MLAKERGITFLGLVILVSFLGIFAYAIIRLAPVYLEYLTVSKAMTGLKADAVRELSVKGIRAAIGKRLDVDDVKSITEQDFEVTREGRAWQVHGKYDADVPFIGNLSFVVHFDKTVTIDDQGGP
jgi:hypothetical protein